ncbi:hypothetical protein TCON_0616 [Astathelohania contejeani]|uniref:Anaphase-promoting complex subunit 1 n=1 Tax=Astathelohania contejeani TaxID=164912 RepID=A0ABQ7I1B3_9MICR|nr:hypothetical protein TCON_0616 [Thelohania contejeani]
MPIKWKKNKIKIGDKLLRLPFQINGAEKYKHWLLIMHPESLTFYNTCSTFTIQIGLYSNIQVRPDRIVYQQSNTREIMQIMHPYSSPTVLAYYPNYYFEGIINSFIVLRNQNLYFLKEITDGINEQRLAFKIGTEIDFLPQTSDDRINELIPSYFPHEIIFYKFYIVIHHHYSLFFIDTSLIKTEEFRIKRYKPSIYKTIPCESFVKFDRIKMHKDIFLFVNDSWIFYNNEIVCIITDDMKENHENKGNSEVVNKYTHINLKSRLARRMCDILPESMKTHFFKILLKNGFNKLNDEHNEIELIMQYIAYIQNGFIDIEGVVYSNILTILEAEIIYSGDMIKKLAIFNINIPIFTKIYKLSNTKLNHGKNPFNIFYTRIMVFNQKILEKKLFGNNLAYKIIYFCKTKTYKKIHEPFKYTQHGFYEHALVKGLEEHLGDKRFNEVLSLMNSNEVGRFSFDENDLENRRENSFIQRMSTTVGNSFLNFCALETPPKLPVLEFYAIKNDVKSTISMPYKGWCDWPQFHYSCSAFLGGPLNQPVQISEITANEDNEMAMAGRIYALGIQGNIGVITPNLIIDTQLPILSLAYILGISISKRETCDNTLYKLLKYNIEEDTPISMKGASVMGLGFLFLNSDQWNIKNLLINECNKKGNYHSLEFNKGNKTWYDETYRMACTVGLSLVHTSGYIELNDPLCELIVNGIAYYNSGKRKIIKRLSRGSDSRPEEVYYSIFFRLGVRGAISDIGISEYDNNNCINNALIEIIENNYKNDEVYNLYKLSGMAFFLGVSNRGQPNEMFNRLIDLCITLELSKNTKYKILFDSLLLALVLIYNSTFDLKILRILRRQIKKTERIQFLERRDDFIVHSNGSIFETQFGMGYGELMKYKMYLGILCAGRGLFSISKENSKMEIMGLVFSFFINYPRSTIDQEYLQVIRYFIVLSFKSERYIQKKNGFEFKNNEKELETTCNGYKVSKCVEIKPNLNRYFKRKMKTLNSIEKKIVIDILSDYYERYGIEDSEFDPGCFIKWMKYSG